MLQRSHTLSRVERTTKGETRAQRDSFNGATRYRVWKAPDGPTWAQTLTASTEPHAIACGKSIPGSNESSRNSLLQRSHTLSRVESPPWRMCRRPSRAWLQRSHTLSRVESSALSFVSPSAASFNGATRYRVWKASHSPILPRMLLCFNGATRYRVWKVGRSVNPSSKNYGLQRSHTLSRVERSARRERSNRTNCASTEPHAIACGKVRSAARG